MKKILCLLIVISTGFGLLGMGPLQDAKDKIDETKDEILHYCKEDFTQVHNTSALLDIILNHIANEDKKLSFLNGELVDYELGIKKFDILPLESISHFDSSDYVDGYVVRSVVDGENPRLLILAQGVDKQGGLNIVSNMKKVLSDQYVLFRDAKMMDKHLINNHEIVRQDNFVIMVIWDNIEKIIDVFEGHIR